MRPWMRKMLVLGALAGVVYAGATVKIGARPAFGHAYQWVKRTQPVRSATAWLADRWDAWFAHGEDADDDAPKKTAKPRKPAEPRRPGRSATTAEVEAAATPKRVAALESAARATYSELRVGAKVGGSPRTSALAPEAAPAAARRPTRQTKVDERLSSADKKALDALVSSRVAPR